MDDYEEIKDLVNDTNIESININEYPKLKDIDKYSFKEKSFRYQKSLLEKNKLKKRKQ